MRSDNDDSDNSGGRGKTDKERSGYDHRADGNLAVCAIGAFLSAIDKQV
jgi:hypothetical protein